ncbi:hypothetical protein GN156_13270 [bacterium LRH843]|nr:hypothetical protein [bacterium LRH843]
MKSNTLTYIIYASVAIGTVIVLLIVNKDIDNSFSFSFIIGYVIFLLISFLYFITVMVINIKKLKWFGLRRRLFKFIILFILLSVTTYILKYIFRPSDIDVYDLGIPLGLALSLSYFDLMFFKKER